MKTWKKALSCVLALAMVVCLLPVTALAADPAAEVNGQSYTSFHKAFTAISENETATIKLLKNVTSLVTREINSGKNITLDLGGYKYTGSILIRDGSLTVKNGTVEGTIWVFTSMEDKAYNHLVLEKDATVTAENGIVLIQDKNAEGKENAGPDNYGSTIEVYGTLTGGSNSGIFVLGNIHTDLNTAQNPCVLKVYDGAKIDVTGVGIALNGSAKLSVGAAEIKGVTGIEVRAGELVVDGATITGTGTPTTVTPNGNGTTSDGAGIAVSQHTTKLPITVNISGGEISGHTAFYESNPQGNGTDDIEKVSISISDGNFTSTNPDANAVAVYSEDKNGFISGGTFSSNVSQYVPSGMIAEDEDGDGIYTIGVRDNAEAMIGTAAYATLAEAIAAAGDNDVIRILRDVTVTDAISPKKILTFQGVTKADGTKPQISSSGNGIFSQSGDAQFTLDNLNLVAAKDGQWYIYHSANKLTVNNCDFTMADGVSYTGNIIMGEGQLNQDTFVQYSLTFTNNTVTSNSRAAITGIGNNSVITGNVIDLIDEKHASDNASRTSVLSLVAKEDGGGVTITGNTFKNANRVLAVDNSTLAASDLTYQQNRFIDTRFALELSPTNNEDCGVYNINHNYYEFDGVVSAPKIENADDGSNHFAFADDDNSSTEYVFPEDGERLVENDVYYTAPTMRPEDLNTYVPTPSKPQIPPVIGSLLPIWGSQMQSTFVDVTAVDYYYDAVNWAVDNGITSGTGRYSFSPDEACTRAQAVTFLWRAAGSPAPKSTATPFVDVDSNAYYYKAVLWAVENGVTVGTSDTTFSPSATCTRAQIVTFLYRAFGKQVNRTASFTDVAADAYYAPAVAWAAADGVTGGTTPTTFSPEAVCTRGQIVTFLYRACAN